MLGSRHVHQFLKRNLRLGICGTFLGLGTVDRFWSKGSQTLLEKEE
jgi:hypothetical protein